MVAHICSITSIVNPSHFYGSVVSTSVAQLTKMTKIPVGCRPDGLSPTRLSPRRFASYSSINFQANSYSSIRVGAGDFLREIFLRFRLLLPRPFRSRERKFPTGSKSYRERKFSRTFASCNFCSQCGTFVPGSEKAWEVPFLLRLIPANSSTWKWSPVWCMYYTNTLNNMILTRLWTWKDTTT